MRLNGFEVSLVEAVSVAQLLFEQGYAGDKVAVEVNGQLVPKAHFGEVMVDDQAAVAVVSFVGGG